MAIGDILRAGSTLFDSGSGASELNFLGSLANYGQGYLDEAEADARKKAALRNAQVANAYQMEQAQRNNAVNDAIRNEILQKSANLQEALKQAYSYLGMPYQPTAQEINQDFVDIYSQNSKDLDKLAAMAMSKGYASNLAKGMGDSTLQEDEAANLAAKLADKYSAMQQTSYDQAIARADSRAKTLNSGRDTLLSEINTVYGGKNIDNLKGVYSSTFQNPGTSTDYAQFVSGQQSGLEKQNNDDLTTLIDAGKNLFGLDKQQEEEIAAINPLGQNHMADLFEIGKKIGTRDTIDNAFSRQADGRRKNAEAFQKWAADQADQGLPIDINNAMAYRDSISRLDPTLRGGQLSDAVVESIIGRQNERSAQKILADAAQATTDINTGYDNLSKLVDTTGDYGSFLDKVAISQTGKVDDASKIQAQAATHQFRLDESQFYELQSKKRQQAIADASQTGMFTDSQDVDDINFHFKDRPAWLREGLVRMMEDKEQKARINKVDKIKKFFENFQNDQWATYDKPTFLMETKARFETEGLEFTDEDSRMFEGMYTARSRVAQNINQNKALEAARKDPTHAKLFDLDSTPTEEQAFESFNSAITRAGGIPYASIEDWRAGEGGSYWLRARTQQTREFEERKTKEETLLLENLDATFGKDGDYTEGKTYNNFKKALASAGIVGEGDGAQPGMIALAAELSQNYFISTATAEEMVRYAQSNWDPAKQTMSDFAQILIGKYKPLTIASYKAQARAAIANRTGTRVTPRSRLVDHYATTTAKLNGWSASLKNKLELLPASARDENGSWVAPEAQLLIEGARKKILEEIELYTKDVTTDTFYLFTDNRSAEAQQILLNGKAELQSKLLALDTIIASAQPRGEEKDPTLINRSDGKNLSGTPTTDTAVPNTTGNTSNAPVSTTAPVPKGQEIPIENPQGTGRDKTLQIISGGEKDLAAYEVDNEGWIRVRPTEDTIIKRGAGPQSSRSTLRPRELTWDTLGEDLQSMLVDEALRVMRQNVMNPLLNQSYGQTPWRAMRFAIEDSNLSVDSYKGETETKILQTAWAIAQDAFLKNVGE